MTPSADGTVGVWLYAGPFFGNPQQLRFTPSATSQAAGDDSSKVVTLQLGSSVTSDRKWSLLASDGGVFDLRRATGSQANTYAMFAGLLRASQDTRVTMIFGADDGLLVQLGPTTIVDKDLVRPPFASLHVPHAQDSLRADDAVTVDLPKGDHPLLIRLRQRTGDWKFSAKLFDAATLTPSPHVQVVLVGADNTQVQMRKLLSVDVSMTAFGDRYEPKVHISAPSGMPRAMQPSIRVSAAIDRPGVPPDQSVKYTVNLGKLSITTTRVHAFEASLPAIYAQDVMHDAKEYPVKYTVSVGDEQWTFVQSGHPEVRQALDAIDQALVSLAQNGNTARRHSDVLGASLRLYRSRLNGFLSSRDTDTDATVREARAAHAFATHVREARDPIALAAGPVRLAYPSPLDGKDRPFAMYAPAPNATTATNASTATSGDAASGDKPPPRRPLVVALHGLNGLPMQMLRIFFGKDHPTRRSGWEDRHVPAVGGIDAYVVAPSGFGNISYREFGEADVMYLVRWMKETFPIDADRVYITGPSMGGTGAASVGLRYADQFASILSLCGYHSYSLRRDMSHRKLRWWDKALGSYWSTVSWADNGRNLPLYIVHGTKDLPVENSGVLIDRYKQLGYRITSEHPDTGHNVWQQTYEGGKGYRWMAAHRRDTQPKHVVAKTASLRYGSNAWVHITWLAQHLTWGKVEARVVGANKIDVTTSDVRGFQLDRPDKHIAADKPVTVVVDGTSIAFAPGETLGFIKDNGTWKASPDPRAKASAPGDYVKTAGLSGPIRDAFMEPLVFVVGTRDPSLTHANWLVAKALSEPGFGVEARWPVVADVDVTDLMAASHALYLIGSAQSNSYVARIDAHLPIRVREGAVLMHERRFASPEVGSLFVYPNPLHPKRYVVVLQAPTVAGTLRALSLPRMLPDYVVYDERIASARGQIVLADAHFAAAGLFDDHWKMSPSLTQEALDP